jgi:hypothetical protein
MYRGKLERYGIPLRGADQSPWCRRGQLGFGKRVVNGGVLSCFEDVAEVSSKNHAALAGPPFWTCV